MGASKKREREKERKKKTGACALCACVSPNCLFTHFFGVDKSIGGGRTNENGQLSMAFGPIVNCGKTILMWRVIVIINATKPPP